MSSFWVEQECRDRLTDRAQLARRHLPAVFTARNLHGWLQSPNPMTAMYDETDLEILRLLQENARISNAEVARRIGLAPSAVFQRIRKLEDQGIITGYQALLSPEALGHALLAFITIQTAEGARARETAAMLAAIPEVLEVHRVVGDDCFFLKVRVRDTDALGALLDEKIQPLPQVASTRTTIVLSTTKDTDPVVGLQNVAQPLATPVPSEIRAS